MDYEDPRERLERPISVGQVYTDSRSDEELVVLYEGAVVLCRDEGGGHRLIPRKQFEQAVGGDRYTLDRNEDGTYAKDGKLRRLKEYLQELESADGRTASHKAEAVNEVLDILDGDESLDDMETVDFEQLDHIGAKTAANLVDAGYTTKGDIRSADDEELLDVSGIGQQALQSLRRHVD